jgi:predicted RNA-binding Zn ribbon-like protein
VDLASYADLAIDLVNTHDPDRGDTLRDLDGLRALLAHRPHLGGRITHRDLDTVRELRAELRAVFAAADAGDEDVAIDRLNSLLIRHPVHPQLARHDALSWHVHLNEGGSVPDRYAARAAMGLAVQVDEHGIDRLGVCHAEGCGRAFFDTTAGRSRRYCSDRCAHRGAVPGGRPPDGKRATAAAERPRRLRVSEPVPAVRHGGRPGEKTAARDGGQ